MTQALAVSPNGPVDVVQPMGGPAVLFRSNEPAEIVRAATSVAQALAPVIKEQKLFTNIQGREHVRVEGWTLLGTMLGVFPVCVWSRPIENGWEARVEARTMSGALVGAAEASCMRDEPTWNSRHDYALRSMAQTRATSKALRLPLGFIITLAGYDATPAEEMDGIDQPRRQSTQGAPRFQQQQQSPVQRANSGPSLSSEAQHKAIYAIARKMHNLDDSSVEAEVQARYRKGLTALTKSEASEMISALQTPDFQSTIIDAEAEQAAFDD